MIMCLIGWVLTVAFIIDSCRPFQTISDLNARLQRSSKISVVMDVMGKMLTYYLVLSMQEKHIPRWVVAQEMPTTMIEAVVKF